MPTLEGAHELHRHKRLPDSKHLAVSVSVGEEVMNSTATRLFRARQYCIPLCQLVHRASSYKATDKATSFGFSALLLLLSILEAPFSPPDDHLDAMAFITSWVLHLHHSNKLFSPCRSKASVHSSNRLPPRQALLPLFPALLQILHTRL